MRAFSLAFWSKTHVCLYGRPGTAKTLLSDTWMGHILDAESADYFPYQMTAFTTDGELFGTPSIKAIREEDVIRRIGKGKAQHAKVVRLDEGFKASSSTLNALLSLANERIFYNDVPENSPLCTMIITSNERAAGPELAAFEDRLHTWLIINKIQEPKRFQDMLRASLDRQDITPHVTWEQVDQIHAAVRNVVVTDELLEAMAVLREDLSRLGVEPSDRRFAQTLPIIQAEAFMGGRGTATIADMRCLRNCLWTETGEIGTVDRAVLELASPLDREALELKDGADALAVFLEEIRAMDDVSQKPERRKKGIDFAAKMESLDEEIRVLQDKCVESGRTSDVLEELVSHYDRMYDVADAEVFHVARRARKAS